MQLLLNEETAVMKSDGSAELMAGFGAYTDTAEMRSSFDGYELVASSYYCVVTSIGCY